MSDHHRHAHGAGCIGEQSIAGLSRRALLGRVGMGLGGMALAHLVNPDARTLSASDARRNSADRGVLGGQPHFPAKAKRVIYLFMAGGPSQLDLFDYKPCSTSATARSCRTRCGRVSGSPACPAISRRCRSPARCSSSRSTAQHGAWVSELLPHTAKIVDELCIVRSMHTEAINHDPAITFFQTGSQIAGRPSMGAWLQLRPRQRRTRTCRRSSC